MRTWCGVVCVLVAVYLNHASAQLPPRLQIPGAVLFQGARPAPGRPQRIGGGDFPRPRRPSIPNAAPLPLRDVRPVVEEEEDLPSHASNFDDEVNKLGISALTSAVRQAEEEEAAPRPSPLPFRPEKPIPITRDQIRERPVDSQPSRPAPIPRPLPVLRPLPAAQPRPIARQERPVVRQEIDDEEENIPRQPVRKARPQPPPQQYRPAPAQRPAPRPQYDDGEEPQRRKKPVSQILRKYRTDNEDGSITWGFENDDGTFKEENLGIDCITRGKYGYVDPDGVRREYSYESGNKCDEPDPEDLEEDPLPRLPPKKPLNIGKPQPQFRPPGPQYSN